MGARGAREHRVRAVVKRAAGKVPVHAADIESALSSPARERESLAQLCPRCTTGVANGGNARHDHRIVAITGITPILNVSDVPASFAWFESLGWRRGFAWNGGGMIACAADANEHGPAHFGSVCAAHRDADGREHAEQIFLCHGGQGSRGSILPRFPGDDETDGVWMSWWIDSVAALNALHATCAARGYGVTMPPTNKPWGVREFHLRHPDGHMFRVSCGLPPATA